MRLIVDNIAIHAGVGVYKWERVIKRLIVLNLDLDISECRGVMDYELVVNEVKKVCGLRHYDYIEEISFAVRQNKSKTFKIEEEKICIKISKPNIKKDLFYASTVFQ